MRRKNLFSSFLKVIVWGAVVLSLLGADRALPNSRESSVPLAGLIPGTANTYNGLRGVSFDDGWKFHLGDLSGAQESSFDDSNWRSLDLPHDWSIELPFDQASPAGGSGAYLNGGIGWYRKSFSVPVETAGKLVTVQFDGVYMDSEVWINGQYLGNHPYGYTSFEYDLTPYLNFGSGDANLIAVRVNNHQPNSRWYSGSGIYRNMWLTVTSPIHMAYTGMYVTTPVITGTEATVAVSSRVQNQSTNLQRVAVATVIVDARGKTVAAGTSAVAELSSNGEYTFTQELSVTSPRLWSVDDPYLYTVQAQVLLDGVVVDTYATSLGIRSFYFDADTGFFLNGQNMKLKGVCMHHDLGSLGAAVNYRAIERQVQILKGMGINAIRTAHNPPAPELLDIADRLGVLIMDEAFDAWQTGKTAYDYHLYFDQWAQADIQSMVRRDRNHPSVILWSIGNEIPQQADPGGLAIAQNLIRWVKAEDSTRPITQALNDQYLLGDLIDVVGYNYGTSGVYYVDHLIHPGWKIFGSETSSAVRSRGVYHLPTTQNVLTAFDYQTSSYDNSVVSWGASAETSWKADNNHSYVAGQFIWTGFDYLGEPTPYGWPAKSSYFGIVDTAGFPKDIYYFYQSRWTTAPMVHLLPHWNWSSGQTVQVWAYTNCDSVELFINNRSLGERTFRAGGRLHLIWEVPFEEGTLRAVGRRDGKVVATDEVRTAGAPAKIELKADRTVINADGRDLVFIETDILDARGVLVPAASNIVNFSVSGPGKIVGVDNGDAISLEPYQATRRSAFNGKALAIIQSTGGPGLIVVTASSAEPGLNIAQGKPASADSEGVGIANAAANGNDGDISTGWRAADGNAPHWWKVDLGSDYTLNGCQVWWQQGGKIHRYKVEVSSDDINWDVVIDKTNNTDTAQMPVDLFNINARYVRLTITGLEANDRAEFYEFKVFSGAEVRLASNTVAVYAGNAADSTSGTGPLERMFVPALLWLWENPLLAGLICLAIAVVICWLIVWNKRRL